MSKLLLFYLTDARRHHTFNHFIKLLSDCKQKDNIYLYILTHSDDSDFYSEVINSICSDKLNFGIKKINQEPNYLIKVKEAIHFAEENNYKYMCKCDNDIFIPSSVLDYIVENLNSLDDPKNITLGPVLTTGIPTVDLFVKQFCTKEEQAKLYNLYKQTKFYSIWGTNYTPLNKFSTENPSTEWNEDEYYKGVTDFPNVYKGIHPVRINENLLKEIHNIVLSRKEDFFNNKSNDYSLFECNNRPYLCNSFFCIKTDIYKEIVYDNSLYVDIFDEVPLNKYTNKHNKTHLFVNNGFAIHITYNWYSNFLEYEKIFCEQLFN